MFRQCTRAREPRGPGVLPARIEAPAGLIDVAPTVLAALGLDIRRSWWAKRSPRLSGRPPCYGAGRGARRVAGATYLIQGVVD
jgi:arylsulfatase A-like enzyme